MNKFAFIFSFSLGAAIGSAVTWKIAKAKFEEITQEEIASVKEAFSKREKKLNDKVEEDKNKPEEVEAYKKMTNELGYTNYSGQKEEKGGDKDVDYEKPYVITPEEFSDGEYESVSFNYYADGVITDDNDQIVTDVEGTIGSDSLNHFGEYEDDTVYVRNDKLKRDYEILKDQRKYSSLKKPAYPHWVEE